MTSEKLHALHQARPFLPFTIHLADGRNIPVKHSELMAYKPGGRTAVVVGDREEILEIVDLLLVTRLTVGKQSGSNGQSRRRGKS